VSQGPLFASFVPDPIGHSNGTRRILRSADERLATMSMQTEAPSRNETQGHGGGSKDGGTEVQERIHGLETALAVQTATTAGMGATQAAAQAGMAATAAAAQAGNIAVMAVGSVSLIVGMFLGLTISRTRA
jgi:hypothetical protein